VLTRNYAHKLVAVEMNTSFRQFAIVLATNGQQSIVHGDWTNPDAKLSNFPKRPSGINSQSAKPKSTGTNPAGLLDSGAKYQAWHLQYNQQGHR